MFQKMGFFFRLLNKRYLIVKDQFEIDIDAQLIINKHIISFIMKQGQKSSNQLKSQILDCFNTLYSNVPNPQNTKKANSYLLELEKDSVSLLMCLFQIFDENIYPNLSFQALIYANNIVKRTWTIRRFKQEHVQYESLKKQIRLKILQYLIKKERLYMKTQFDMLKYIAKMDYPHSYPYFTDYIHQCLEEIQPDQINVLIFKQLKEIFYELGQRKNVISKKLFVESLRSILQKCCFFSDKFKNLIENSLNSEIIKLSKYNDQITLYILRISPNDIMEDQIAPKIMRLILQKLQFLLTFHNASGSKQHKSLLEKNIKSLIFDMTILQSSKPLILSFIIKQFYQILSYVLGNYTQFTQNSILRFSLIAIRRILREFAYYSPENIYMQSIQKKNLPSNKLQMRRQCATFYQNTFNEGALEGLMNFLITCPIDNNGELANVFDLEEGLPLEISSNEKEYSLQSCSLSLIQTILERFPDYSLNLLKNLISHSHKNSYSNLTPTALSNLFSIISILPSTCKKNSTQILLQIPIMQIIQYIYGNPQYKLKFAQIINGWMNAFADQELNNIADVILSFIDSEVAKETANVDVVMGCCQCLRKVMRERINAVDVVKLVKFVIPVALGLFEKMDNPQVLWPMINLISIIILKAEFDTEIILTSLDPHKMSLLISNNSPILLEALSEMFKNLLCIIPRNKPASSLYQLILTFLNNHLSDLYNTNYQKIFNLWYIVVRQYSPIHNTNILYLDLFHNHYRKNLFRKTPTLIYILQQYLLTNLIETQLKDIVQIIQDCYVEASFLEKQEKEMLKIAALSFHITLISKYSIEEVNSFQMLKLVIQDFFVFQFSEVSATVHNSLLAIVNRYIWTYGGKFLQFLLTIGITLQVFLGGLFENMKCLTSKTAMKINAISLLSLLDHIPPQLLLQTLPTFLQKILPELQHFESTIISSTTHQFVGKVDNSPNLRFAANILSDRKDEIRKKDGFELINLIQLFREKIAGVAGRMGVEKRAVGNCVEDASMRGLFQKYC